ncbi:hypothetical protein HMPREF0208_04113 [Citrobacter koseri]|uniref:Uncharacterized protein n=1 Tax=Citrobacter koseri (strain ATCC BAA-895 / CDC 4225-83 / SGSC4696) TaxID=290338 RepID=A8ACI2_CITK8|nr:hypothetical protein CKO_00016 [Citrobacter koseri ATCC BAA-895]KXB40633.1 hypothetical protein HMPREF0208_04113 [Citrobacter koseri]
MAATPYPAYGSRRAPSNCGKIISRQQLLPLFVYISCRSAPALFPP